MILVGILWATGLPEFSPYEWTVLLAFSLLPLFGSLCYVIGLAKIGASLTSVIASFSILLTIVFQLALFGFDVQVILPENVPVAIFGGILGVAGIFLIHRVQSDKALVRS
jgi:hypothetical protein